jgi:hypothetical protein
MTATADGRSAETTRASREGERKMTTTYNIPLRGETMSKRQRYALVVGGEPSGREGEITGPPTTMYVMARCHRQHTPYESILVGVSRASKKRLDALLRAGAKIRLSDSPYRPRLVGCE